MYRQLSENHCQNHLTCNPRGKFSHLSLFCSVQLKGWCSPWWAGTGHLHVWALRRNYLANISCKPWLNVGFRSVKGFEDWGGVITAILGERSDPFKEVWCSLPVQIWQSWGSWRCERGGGWGGGPSGWGGGGDETGETKTFPSHLFSLLLLVIQFHVHLQVSHLWIYL